MHLHLLRQLRHHRGPGLLDRPRNLEHPCEGEGLSVCVPDAEGREQCQIQIPLGIEGLWIRFLRKGGGIGIGHAE
jgi:hypothetical protein